MEPLAEEHDLQVQGFLRFTKFKRDQHLREVKGILTDFSEYRVKESEVYTTKEVHGLLGDLGEEVLQVVETELENSSYVSGLLLRLLFQQAEMADLVMAADTNELENEFLLKQIAASAEEALKKPASAFARKPQRLSKLGAEQVSDARVLKERDELRRQVDQLEGHLSTATLRASSGAAASDEAQGLRAQLQACQQQLEAEKAKLSQLVQKDSMQSGALSADAEKEIKQLKLEFTLEAEEKGKAHAEVLSDAKKRNKKLKAEVEKLEAELRVAKLEAGKASEVAGAADARMSESKQFQQMRKIMQQKSEEVTTLRRLLAKYEPDSVADGDA